MCGLVGVVSKNLSFKHHEVFQQMLVFDTVRGFDSTGIAAIGKSGWVVEKEVLTAAEFLELSGYNARPFSHFKNNPFALIGHNRKATQGKIVPENAHPFEFENIVGAHNGTIPTHNLLKFKGYSKFDIDSQILYNEIDTFSIEDVWAKTNGAMALSWYDKRTDRVHLIRNKERPLFIAQSKDNSAMFWASEPWMIRVATSRCSVEIGEVGSLKENTLLSIHPESHTKVVIESSVLKEYVPPPVPAAKGNFYGGWQNNFKGQSNHWGDSDDAFAILSLHTDAGSPVLKYAKGVTSDGEMVKINIPYQDSLNAKNQFQGKGLKNGLWIPKKTMFSALELDFDYTISWPNIEWQPLKKGEKLIVDDKGYKILSSKTILPFPTFAPWHSPHQSLTKDAWEHKVNCGCGLCGKIPDWEDNKEIHWLDKDAFLCKECKVDKETLDKIGVSL
jgi:predicted glutamine amidotransferase